MNPYPKFLITLEKWLARRESVSARRWTLTLATLRLNSVIGGLLTSIYGQVYAASFNVRLTADPNETPQDHTRRELEANIEHQQSALAAIELMVYNELKQRGLLHLIGPPLRQPPYDVRDLRAGDAWTEARGDVRRPIRVLVVPPGAAPSLSGTVDADLVLDAQGVVRKDRRDWFGLGSTVDLGAVISRLSREWHVDVKRLG